MKSIIDENHVALTSSNYVKEICSPLNIIGVKFFCYIRVYNDLSHSSLYNNGAWAEFYYFKDYKNIFLINYEMMESIAGYQYILFNSYPENIGLKNLRDYCGLGQGIILINQEKNYRDFYVFAGAEGDHKILDYFVNNIPALKKFIYYFKEKGADIIAETNKNLIYLPDIDVENNIELKNKKNLELFLRKINTNRFIISQDIYLTKKQMECSFYSIQGKTNKEIGVYLNISFRTVEDYLKQARKKLKCSSKQELNELLRPYAVNPNCN